MVFLSLNRGFATNRIQLSTLLLCTSHVTTQKNNILYLFNFAVVYIAQKRGLRCSAVVFKENEDRRSYYQAEKMCPLKSENESNLFEKYKSHYSSAKKQFYKDALFVLGPMGSGKTTIIKNKIQTHKIYGKYAYVDTDEIMEQLPGFNKLQVNNFYPIARQIAIKLTDWLLDSHLSFVAEGTCVQYEELIDYMIRLKRKGYTIKVCKLNAVDLDLVLKRAANRETRQMKLKDVKDIYIQSNHGLKELYKLNEENTIFENVELDELWGCKIDLIKNVFKPIIFFSFNDQSTLQEESAKEESAILLIFKKVWQYFHSSLSISIPCETDFFEERRP
jgi:Uncharacterized protein conserved in bacteria